MSRTLLVTGAPGWLADALVRQPSRDIASFERVRFLAQQSVDTKPWLELGYGVEVQRGDVTSRFHCARAVRGVDAVLHAAAVIHVSKIRHFYEVNTEGTRCLGEAAARAGVRRFVFVSSNAAAGRSETGAPLNEEMPPRPLSHYGRSKLLGEQALFALPGSMGRVVLRPCMFYGPPVPIRHVEIFRRLLYGWMPRVGDGDFARSLTHVDTIARAAWIALVHPKAAGVYFVADAKPYTLRGIIDAMAAALGTYPRWVPLPRAVSPLAHAVDDVLSRSGRYWRTAHLLGEADWHVGVSVEKARRELGLEPAGDVHEGMRAAVAWCREAGLLARRRPVEEKRIAP